MVHDFEIGAVVLWSDMFEHPHGDDTIKLIAQVAVILQQDGDIQTGAARLRQTLLLR